jgi:hypothetical protein
MKMCWGLLANDGRERADFGSKTTGWYQMRWESHRKFCPVGPAAPKHLLLQGGFMIYTLFSHATQKELLKITVHDNGFAWGSRLGRDL